MKDLVIRAATPADIPGIAAIYAEAVANGTATFELEPPDAREMTRRMGDISAGGFPYLVAAGGSEILGYAYAAPYRTRPAYRFTVENSIYVARSAHRRGVGRRLLADLIAACEADGLRLMVAVIGDSANVASIELHRAAGFQMVGTFHNVGFKFGRWLDSVMMERPLGEGASSAPRERVSRLPA
jgi:phosphinothricin acetyltransferase